MLVNGQNVGALKRSAPPYLRRNLGLVFQDQKLLYDRSVFQSVMLPLAFGDLGSREAEQRARAALDKVGLGAVRARQTRPALRRRATAPGDRACGGKPPQGADRGRADDALNSGVAELAASYGSTFRLAFLHPTNALAVALFSGALGWIGAYL